MRTNIVPDDDLVQQAFTLTGIRTKREPEGRALLRDSEPLPGGWPRQ